MRTDTFTSRLIPGRRRHMANDGGFTLIEVLVTALIVVLLAGGTATALISTTHTSGDQRLRAEADALASQEQARLHGLSDEQLASLGGTPSTHTTTVSGTMVCRAQHPQL